MRLVDDRALDALRKAEEGAHRLAVMFVGAIFDEVDALVDIGADFLRHFLRVSHIRCRPLFSTQVALMRLTKRVLSVDAAAALKSGEKGPSKPMTLPAQKMRLPDLLARVDRVARRHQRTARTPGVEHRRLTALQRHLRGLDDQLVDSDPHSGAGFPA